MTEKLSRRVVHLIDRYYNPKEIYDFILQDPWNYVTDVEKYETRDRALMSFAYTTLGRIASITGGWKFVWDEENKKVLKTDEKHYGLLVDNIELTDKFIKIRGMKVVKRSHKIIDKYGLQVTIRDDFIIPLQEGLYENRFWDQLIPFGWLIVEYLKKYGPTEGKIFPFEDTRAWQIIRKVTGFYPHWFRSQGEHFYGHFLIPDTIKLSKFLKVTDPNSIKHYIGYAWTEQLKDAELTMDFEWIKKESGTIQKRIEGWRK